VEKKKRQNPNKCFMKTEETGIIKMNRGAKDSYFASPLGVLGETDSYFPA